MSMNSVNVRGVRRTDIPRVWEMIRGLAEFEHMTDILTGTPERLIAALFDDPRQLFGLVAESGGTLIGYALYHFTYSSFRTNPRMWLEDLFVAEAARGSGAGDALMRGFVRDALSRGCHRVDWHVLTWNPARAFYERMGATPSADGMIQYGMDAAKMRELTGTSDA